MNIKIKDVEFKWIDYREIEDLQGGLKTLGLEAMEKLKNSFLRHGFFDVKKVWNNNGKYYYLDGHQTAKFLREFEPKLIRNGKQTYEIPCIVIDADNEKDAKEKLLSITIPYGELQATMMGEFLIEFSNEDIESLGEAVNFEFVITDDNFDDNVPDEEKKINPTKSCPKCGYEF